MFCTETDPEIIVPPFEYLSPEKRALVNGDTVSGTLFADTLAAVGREAKLVGLGVGGAIVDTVKDPVSKLPEVGTAAGIGVVLGGLSRAGASGAFLATSIGSAMVAKFTCDELSNKRWSRFGGALADTWQSGRNMDRNVLIAKESLGAFTVDMGVGIAGMKIGSAALGLHGRFAKPGEAGAPRFSYDAFKAEMAQSRLSPETLANSVKFENLIGRGGNARVYRIDGVQDFVIRVPSVRGNQVNLKGAIEPVTDVVPEANVGQPVAKLGDATILKRQDGLPAGGPLYSDAKVMGPDAARRIYEDSIKRAASMDQAAYDEFARTLAMLDGKKLNFDPSKANNVLIDVPNGRFNVVDISPRSPNSTYRHSASDMVITLMDNGFINGLADRGINLVPSYQQIISKSLAAARRHGLPVDLNSSSLEYSFQLAKMEPLWQHLKAKQ
jgi:hypothetical protein